MLQVFFKANTLQRVKQHTLVLHISDMTMIALEYVSVHDHASEKYIFARNKQIISEI